MLDARIGSKKKSVSLEDAKADEAEAEESQSHTVDDAVLPVLRCCPLNEKARKKVDAISYKVGP